MKSSAWTETSGLRRGLGKLSHSQTGLDDPVWYLHCISVDFLGVVVADHSTNQVGEGVKEVQLVLHRMIKQGKRSNIATTSNNRYYKTKPRG